ncbi:MAG: hypothetical protein HOL66_01310 [Rhodospirillaceae bacterium]|nr:hypothetical protein [Rhodospirillaceae bacterium]MBT5242862.1 hypothetical protein [Rhodospirillaceae bacterium]
MVAGKMNKLQNPMVRVGLGTMMFGWKVPLQEASAILERCMSVGIGVIDTSPSYGNGLSETITGMALQKLDRNLITLATKFYLEELPPGQLEAAIRSGLEGSLERLRVDRIDYFTLHNDLNLPDFAALAGIIDKLKSEELIREFHISNFSSRSILAVLASPRLLDAIDGIHVRHNLLFRDDPLWRLHGQRSLNTISFSPLCEGLLTGKYRARSDGSRPGGRLIEATRHRDYYDNLLKDETAVKIEALVRVSGDKGLTLDEYAYQWVLERGQIDTMLMGISSLAQFDLAVKKIGKLQ